MMGKKKICLNLLIGLCDLNWIILIFFPSLYVFVIGMILMVFMLFMSYFSHWYFIRRLSATSELKYYLFNCYLFWFWGKKEMQK